MKRRGTMMREILAGMRQIEREKPFVFRATCEYIEGLVDDNRRGVKSPLPTARQAVARIKRRASVLAREAA